MSEENTQSRSRTSAERAGLAGIAAQIFAAIGHTDGPSSSASAPSVESFLRCSRDQLLGFARSLGVAGLSKLSKAELATRLHALVADIPGVSGAVKQAPAAKTPGAPGAAEGEGASGFPPKYDLGPDAEAEKMPRTIPWGYGQDRVTAMAVDPERLFAYWEVTDGAMEQARRVLGKGGAGAWLNLRVYDVTGRLFDGTNAHSYFDHKIERGDRQWFFDINKPTSAACVEVGLKSVEGFFAKVARSGRVEFPRRDPVNGGHIEWMTVTNASGPHGAPMPGTPPPSGPATSVASQPAGDGAGGQARAAHGNDGHETDLSMTAISLGHTEHQFESQWEWREGEHATWQAELASISWTDPIIRSTWEAGPFTYPVESPVFTEERQGSPADRGQLHYRTENGRVHVTYGPWQVVIRGLGARAERRVLATWQVTHSWSTEASRETTPVQWRPVGPGASEWLAEGGSERAWMIGSELRLRGGSEMFMLGASELRLFGASERVLAGASEYRFRGASERLAAGASEYRFRGASERLAAGASEYRFRGASERLLGGASERLLGGASEQTSASSSEERLVYPASLKAANGTTGKRE